MGEDQRNQPTKKKTYQLHTYIHTMDRRNYNFLRIWKFKFCFFAFKFQILSQPRSRRHRAVVILPFGRRGGVCPSTFNTTNYFFSSFNLIFRLKSYKSTIFSLFEPLRKTQLQLLYIQYRRSQQEPAAFYLCFDSLSPAAPPSRHTKRKNEKLCTPFPAPDSSTCVPSTPTALSPPREHTHIRVVYMF